MTILLLFRCSSLVPQNPSETFHVLIHEQVSPIYITFFLLPPPSLPLLHPSIYPPCLLQLSPFLHTFSTSLSYLPSLPPSSLPLLSSPLSVILLLSVERNMQKSLPYISELLSHFRMK